MHWLTLFAVLSLKFFGGFLMDFSLLNKKLNKSNFGVPVLVDYSGNDFLNELIRNLSFGGNQMLIAQVYDYPNYWDFFEAKLYHNLIASVNNVELLQTMLNFRNCPLSVRLANLLKVYQVDLNTHVVFAVDYRRFNFLDVGYEIFNTLYELRKECSRLGVLFDFVINVDINNLVNSFLHDLENHKEYQVLSAKESINDSHFLFFNGQTFNANFSVD